MDIEFLVQDTFALTRPQWRLVANFDEAGQAFAEAVTQNYKIGEPEKLVEPEEAEDDASSDGGEGDDTAVPDMDEAPSSSEEVDPEVPDWLSLMIPPWLTNSPGPN